MFLIFFLIIRLRLWVLGKKTTEVKSPSRFINGTQSTYLISVHIKLNHLAEAVVVRFFHCKVTLPLPFPCCIIWKSPCAAHMGNYVPTLWGKSIYISYLEFFSLESLPLLPISLFIQSFFYISVWTHGLFFHNLSCYLITMYLFCCSNYSGFCHWELFRHCGGFVWSIS